MHTLNDFKPGDLLVMTSRMRRNGQDVEEQRAAQVACVNYNGNGLVTYTPPDGRCAAQEGLLSTGSGAFDPAKVGTKQYGFDVRVEKVGHRKPWAERHWTPAPGNRGYDLMC